MLQIHGAICSSDVLNQGNQQRSSLQEETEVFVWAQLIAQLDTLPPHYILLPLKATIFLYNTFVLEHNLIFRF